MESYTKLVGPFLMLNLLGKTKKNWIKVEKKILLPWSIIVLLFAGKLLLFKSLFWLLIMKMLSVIEESLI